MIELKPSPNLTPEEQNVQAGLRRELRELLAAFDDAYWREKDDQAEWPDEFFRALADQGWFGITLPEKYGGAGLGLVHGCAVVEEIANSSAGFAGAQAVHTNIFGVEPLAKYGTEEQKQRWLPPICQGKSMVAIGITEPDAGFDTTNIRTFAERRPGGWVLNGRKTFLSRFTKSDKVLLVARTTPREQVQKRTDGITLFLVDTDDPAFSIRRIKFAGRHVVPSFDVAIENLFVPDENVVGEVGRGFYHLLSVLNPERITLAAECIGAGLRAVAKAVEYANQRVVFGRPIGQNQGIQFPLAEAYMKLQAARIMTYHAASLYDRGEPCGEEANTAKFLAAEAAYMATDRAVQTLGGHGYAKDNSVERFWRESRLGLIAPVSQEMTLNFIGEKVLGLPRSY